MHEASGEFDVTALLPQVSVPMLVPHARIVGLAVAIPYWRALGRRGP